MIPVRKILSQRTERLFENLKDNEAKTMIPVRKILSQRTERLFENLKDNEAKTPIPLKKSKNDGSIGKENNINCYGTKPEYVDAVPWDEVENIVRNFNFLDCHNVLKRKLELTNYDGLQETPKKKRFNRFTNSEPPIINTNLLPGETVTMEIPDSPNQTPIQSIDAVKDLSPGETATMVIPVSPNQTPIQSIDVVKDLYPGETVTMVIPVSPSLKPTRSIDAAKNVSSNKTVTMEIPDSPNQTQIQSIDVVKDLYPGETVTMVIPVSPNLTPTRSIDAVKDLLPGETVTMEVPDSPNLTPIQSIDVVKDLSPGETATMVIPVSPNQTPIQSIDVVKDLYPGETVTMVIAVSPSLKPTRSIDAAKNVSSSETVTVEIPDSPNQTPIQSIDAVKDLSPGETATMVIPVSPNRTPIQSIDVVKDLYPGETVTMVIPVSPNVTPTPSIDAVKNLLPGEAVTIEIPVSPNLTGFTVLSSDSLNSNVVQENEGPISKKRLFECEFDQNKVIQVRKKRKRCDRRNCCCFCDCLLTNLTRHMIRQHSNEKEVAEYLALLETCPKESKLKRVAIMENLRTKGNFNYNAEVFRSTPLDQDSQVLLPKKRPSLTNSKTISDFITCGICKSLFVKSSYFKHIQTCLSKQDDTCNPEKLIDETVGSTNQCSNFIKEYGIQIYPICESTTKAMREIIVPMLRKDKYGLGAINDSLIISTCSDYLQSHQDPKDRTIVTRKMRDSAKLLFCVRNKSNDVKQLKDIYHSCNVNIVIEAVQELCMCSQDGEVGTIGMPARLSWVIFESGKRLIDDILTSSMLSEESKKKQKSEIKNFLEIVRRRWKYYISTNAERSRTQKKMLKEKIIPPSEDVKKFGNVLRQKNLQYFNSLKENITAEVYVKLCKVVIAQIMTLNARRPLEAAKIKLIFFQSRHKEQNINTDLLSELTEEEKQSYAYLSEFYVPGKNGQDCSILLTKEMDQSIELIVKCRDVLNIPSSNKFLFARPGLTSAFDGSAIMRELRKLVDLSRPDFMTANGIRHHHATMGTLKGREFTSNLSNHMSHTLEVHNKNYCYPLNIVNRGKLGNFFLGLQGMTPVHEITLQTPQNENIYSSEGSPRLPTKSLIASSKDVDSDEEWVPGQDDIDDDHRVPDKMKKRWTDLEKVTVVKKFVQFIREKRNPGPTKCKQLIDVEPALSSRTTNQVYVFIDNIIKGKLKLTDELKDIIKNQ